MNIWTEVEGDHLRLHYQSKYASGSMGIKNPKELVRCIEDVCGKGSYCLYKGKGERYPDAVSPFDEIQEKRGQHITFWQDGVKTSVIEQARDEARKIWGEDIPEMQIGWLEDQCKSYVEDLEQ